MRRSKTDIPCKRLWICSTPKEKNKMWSKLDFVDGFQQMPMKLEHRSITCRSTPREIMRLNVLILGMKNASAQFQRMMEWVLRDIPNANPYIEDIIVGFDGETVDVMFEKQIKETGMF